MSSALGYVAAASQIALDSILVKPRRGIGSFIPQVTVEEVHSDDLEITEHPVEQGASVADHAFKRPAEVVITCGWSDSPSIPNIGAAIVGGTTATVSGVQAIVTGNAAGSVRDVYAKLLKLQSDRVPFDVFTGKRSYTNMLIKSLSTTTERGTEHALIVKATLRQVLIVSTQTLAVGAPASAQAEPSATQAQTNSGGKSLIETSKFDATGGGRGFQSKRVVQ